MHGDGQAQKRGDEMRVLGREGGIARKRRPDMRDFDDRRRKVPPIEKVSRIVECHDRMGQARRVLLSVPRVRWIEAR
jgi:hypothetical protein